MNGQPTPDGLPRTLLLDGGHINAWHNGRSTSSVLACASPADRELRKWLPPDATIEYLQVTEYGTRHLARFIQLH